jgi:hypothetical protein
MRRAFARRWLSASSLAVNEQVTVVLAEEALRGIEADALADQRQHDQAEDQDRDGGAGKKEVLDQLLFRAAYDAPATARRDRLAQGALVEPANSRKLKHEFI